MTTTLASPSTTPCEASDGWLCAGAGVLVTRLLYLKSGEAADFAIVDAAMSSTYNGRDLIPEAFVEGSHFRLIRNRPAIDEVLRLEQAGPWQQAG